MAAKKAALAGKPAPPDEPEAEKKAEEPEEGEPPRMTLTAEEKAVRFAHHQVSDLAEKIMNTDFQKFSLPEADEGFDTIKYTWNKEKEAAAYVKDWVQGKKQTTRVENLVAGATFKEKFAVWSKNLATWKQKQNDYKG